MEKTCSYYQEYIIPNSLDHFVRSQWNSKSRSDFCLLGCAIKIISSDRSLHKAFFKLCHVKCSAGLWEERFGSSEPRSQSVHSWLPWSSSLVAPGKCIPLEPQTGDNPDLCLWLWAGPWDKTGFLWDSYSQGLVCLLGLVPVNVIQIIIQGLVGNLGDWCVKLSPGSGIWVNGRHKLGFYSDCPSCCEWRTPPGSLWKHRQLTLLSPHSVIEFCIQFILKLWIFGFR